MLDYARTWLALRFDKRGVTAMEYGLIAALMAVVIIAAVGSLGGGIKDAFTSIAGHLTSGT
jgi:pilus assembly protein Flp/PilA